MPERLPGATAETPFPREASLYGEIEHKLQAPPKQSSGVYKEDGLVGVP